MHCFQTTIHFISYLLGCFGSTATRTIGVASKLRGMNGGHAGDVDNVADLRTNSSKPPMPNKMTKHIKRSVKVLIHL